MRPAVVALVALVGSTAALSPRRVKVASWQGAAKTADVAANVERVSVEAAAAAERGVEVVVFPELFLHGYDAPVEALEAGALDEAEVAALVGPTAAAQGVCLAVPYCERFGDRLYNAMAVFDAFGALRCNYRKVNLWGPWERAVFARGDAGSFTPFDLATRSGASLRAGCLICFDVEFPEPSRTLAVQGAEVLLVPTALGAGAVDDATPFRVVPTRALENHVHVVYANLEGPADAGDRDGAAVESYCGRSGIFDPAGEALARAEEVEGGRLLEAVLELDGYGDAISRNPYLHDRAARQREGHYAPLLKPRRALRVTNTFFRRKRKRPPAAAKATDDGGEANAASRREAARVADRAGKG